MIFKYTRLLVVVVFLRFWLHSISRPPLLHSTALRAAADAVGLAAPGPGPSGDDVPAPAAPQLAPGPESVRAAIQAQPLVIYLVYLRKLEYRIA